MAKRQPFTTDFHLRAPTALTDAVTEAANRNMTTASEYIRGAIMDRLKLDNVTRWPLRDRKIEKSTDASGDIAETWLQRLPTVRVAKTIT